MPRRLTVADEQMTALSESQRERFITEMVAYLRAEYAAAAADLEDEALREMVTEGITAARGYSIVLERNVARYVELRMDLTPDFDQSTDTPWAKGILLNPQLSEDQKLDRIHERVMFGGGDGQEETRLSGQTPRPIHDQAARTAYERVWDENPDLQRRPLTLAPADNRYRRQWMDAYRTALADLEVPPPTSCPNMEVGSPVAAPPTPTGKVLVTVLEGTGQSTIDGAEVYLAGPACHKAVTDVSGTARFRGVAAGEYQILAQHPMRGWGRAATAVARDAVEIVVRCAHAARVPGAAEMS